MSQTRSSIMIGGGEKKYASGIQCQGDLLPATIRVEINKRGAARRDRKVLPETRALKFIAGGEKEVAIG